MRVLSVTLPSVKMKQLFALFDADESGTIDHGACHRPNFGTVYLLMTASSPYHDLIVSIRCACAPRKAHGIDTSRTSCVAY